MSRELILSPGIAVPQDLPAPPTPQTPAARREQGAASWGVQGRPSAEGCLVHLLTAQDMAGEPLRPRQGWEGLLPAKGLQFWVQVGEPVSGVGSSGGATPEHTVTPLALGTHLQGAPPGLGSGAPVSQAWRCHPEGKQRRENSG